MTRPNFFIVGAPKCGTTAWYEYLGSHPDIFFAEVKEPHYFCTDFPNFRWAKTEAEYLAYFKHCRGEKIVGEASVQYLYSREAASNIAAFAPHAKILIFLRQPAAFLSSYHNQLRLNLDEDIEDFAGAWQASSDPEKRSIPRHCREPRQLDYRAVGRFGDQVARYASVFSPGQIKILDFEQWTRNPRATYVEIQEFLGVEDDGREDFPAVNESRAAVSVGMSRLLRRPPGWVLAISRLLRRITGRQRLGLAGPLRRVNYRRGERAPFPTALQAEIDEYYAEDQQLLTSLRAALSAATKAGQ